jgi:hypothetical protein
MKYVSRNYALGFAERTRKNLRAIENAYDRHEDVHVVTQLATSLLGLLVFPREKLFMDSVNHLKISTLLQSGWPRWEITVGSSVTLGDLVRHVRNAVTHGHMTFSSDSRNMDEVQIEFEDYKRGEDKPYWVARIGATDLRSFCLQFIDLLDQTVG